MCLEGYGPWRIRAWRGAYPLAIFYGSWIRDRIWIQYKYDTCMGTARICLYRYIIYTFILFSSRYVKIIATLMEIAKFLRIFYSFWALAVLDFQNFALTGKQFLPAHSLLIFSRTYKRFTFNVSSPVFIVKYQV